MVAAVFIRFCSREHEYAWICMDFRNTAIWPFSSINNLSKNTRLGSSVARQFVPHGRETAAVSSFGERGSSF